MQPAEAIERALERGPVTTALNAYSPGFMSYTSGVLQNVDTQNINHAMVIVGYTEDYWILQNSWGTWWGDQGYIKVAKNTNFWINIAVDAI